MNELAQLLEDYDDVILRYRAIMEKELQSLKGAGKLDDSSVEAKQSIVDELGEKLGTLRSLRESSGYVEPSLKSRFDQVQHKFMQVIKLDREVEKQYLARQTSGRGSRRAMAAGGGDRAAARRLYGMS